MKRDSIIALKEMLSDLGSEVNYLNDVLRQEKIFIDKREIDHIAKKCLKTFELTMKLKYQK